MHGNVCVCVPNEGLHGGSANHSCLAAATVSRPTSELTGGMLQRAVPTKSQRLRVSTGRLQRECTLAQSAPVPPWTFRDPGRGLAFMSNAADPTAVLT